MTLYLCIPVAAVLCSLCAASCSTYDGTAPNAHTTTETQRTDLDSYENAIETLQKNVKDKEAVIGERDAMLKKNAEDTLRLERQNKEALDKLCAMKKENEALNKKNVFLESQNSSLKPGEPDVHPDSQSIQPKTTEQANQDYKKQVNILTQKLSEEKEAHGALKASAQKEKKELIEQVETSRKGKRKAEETLSKARYGHRNDMENVGSVLSGALLFYQEVYLQCSDLLQNALSKKESAMPNTEKQRKNLKQEVDALKAEKEALQQMMFQYMLSSIHLAECKLGFRNLINYHNLTNSPSGDQRGEKAQIEEAKARFLNAQKQSNTLEERLYEKTEWIKKRLGQQNLKS